MLLVFGMTLYTCHYLLTCYHGIKTLPSPNQEYTTDSDGFPDVDWRYWQGVNSDIIGWITIPDTEIDYPILQSNPNDRDFYLTHNVYKDWDFMGAVHLDADCSSLGFASPNAVILAHSLDASGAGTMFTPLTQYYDEEFASQHSRILIQTPDNKLIVDTSSVQTINGSSAVKITEFSNDEELVDYEQSCYDNSEIKIANEAPGTRQMVTLCTCSYFFNPSNERILVYGSVQARI